MSEPLDLSVTDDASVLARSVARLQSLMRGRPATGAGDRLMKSLAAGAQPADALASYVPAPIATLVRETAPEDLGGVLDEVGAAWARSERRRSQTKASSAYPVLLAIASGAVGAIVLGLTLPALSALNVPHQLSLDARPLDSTLPMLSICLSVFLLLFSAALWALDLPVPPFATARHERNRALVLSVAASLSSRGTPLSLAVRAASKLVSGSVRLDAEQLAGALERGEPQNAGGRLLGALGASLFAAAAAEGAGPSSLSALAAVAESSADHATPKAALRAEILSMLLGGLGVAVAAASLMLTYAGALGRS